MAGVSSPAASRANHDAHPARQDCGGSQFSI